VPMVAVNLDVANVRPVVRSRYPYNDAVQGSLTPRLYASAEDLDAWPSGALQYHFKLCGGTPAAPTGCADSGWIADGMWQVPAGTLAWGRNARWQVQVKDAGGATSETAGPVWLSPQVPQPAITGQ